MSVTGNRVVVLGETTTEGQERILSGLKGLTVPSGTILRIDASCLGGTWNTVYMTFVNTTHRGNVSEMNNRAVWRIDFESPSRWRFEETSNSYTSMRATQFRAYTGKVPRIRARNAGPAAILAIIDARIAEMHAIPPFIREFDMDCRA